MSVGNYVSFIGRFTKEPEVKTVGNGDNRVCNFTLARNRPTKDKDHPEADFVDCVAWNGTADLIGKYFSKGNRIGVSGSLSTRTYEDTNGVKRKVTEISVRDIEFIENKSESERNSMNDKKENKESDIEQEVELTPDDELPF